MSITEAVLQKLSALPPEKQELVLDFAASLSEPAVTAKPYSFLDVAMSLNLQGPPDWSANFEEYLRGDKKDAL